MLSFKENGFSIILCTYNGRNRLAETLIHIINLKIPQGFEIELIVIDNRSSDGTSDFVKEFFEDYEGTILVRLISQPMPGKAFALEMGFDEASYAYAIICDDDNWLDSNYLLVAQSNLERYKDVGIFGGRSIAMFEEEAPVWFGKVERAFVVGGQAKQVGYFDEHSDYVWGAGMVFKMEIWQKLRSCQFSFLIGKNIGKAVGEDSELSLLAKFLGYRFYYDDKLVFRHFMPKERIRWEVAVNYFKGFGITKPYFILYKNLIRSGEMQSWFMIEKEILRLMLYIGKEYFYFKRRYSLDDQMSELKRAEIQFYFREVYSFVRIRKKAHSLNTLMGRLFTSNVR